MPSPLSTSTAMPRLTDVVADQPGLAVGALGVGVAHHRHGVGDGPHHGVADEVGEADLAHPAAAAVAVDDLAVDLEQLRRDVAEARRRRDGEAADHVGGDRRGRRRGSLLVAPPAWWAPARAAARWRSRRRRCGASAVRAAGRAAAPVPEPAAPPARARRGRGRRARPTCSRRRTRATPPPPSRDRRGTSRTSPRPTRSWCRTPDRRRGGSHHRQEYRPGRTGRRWSRRRPATVRRSAWLK